MKSTVMEDPEVNAVLLMRGVSIATLHPDFMHYKQVVSFAHRGKNRFFIYKGC